MKGALMDEIDRKTLRESAAKIEALEIALEAVVGALPEASKEALRARLRIRLRHTAEFDRDNPHQQHSTAVSHSVLGNLLNALNG
jgi:hypothetical protein